MKKPHRPRVSIVIPTYNERENIAQLIGKVERTLAKSRLEGEIIVVDDNSPDGTGDAAERLAKASSSIRVIHRSGRLGLGTAYSAGIRAAKGSVIITMDADLSHPPSAIPALLGAIGAGADIALGSRYVKGGKIANWGPYRRLVSKGANTLAKLVLGIRPNDLTTGYRAYRREALERLGLGEVKSTGYSFLMEILCRAERKGLKISEVPITFVDRKGGRSKLGPREQVKFAASVARLALNR